MTKLLRGSFIALPLITVVSLLPTHQTAGAEQAAIREQPSLSVITPRRVDIPLVVPAAVVSTFPIATEVLISQAPVVAADLGESVPLPEVQAPRGARCPQWWAAARRAGWPASAMRTLDYVMARESGCNPRARNRSGATGLLQMMPMHWRGKFNPTDPYANLAAGYRLYKRAGWAPWQVCGFKKGCKGR